MDNPTIYMATARLNLIIGEWEQANPCKQLRTFFPFIYTYVRLTTVGNVEITWFLIYTQNGKDGGP